MRVEPERHGRRFDRTTSFAQNWHSPGEIISISIALTGFPEPKRLVFSFARLERCLL